jgi:hypothetical protein
MVDRNSRFRFVKLEQHITGVVKFKAGYYPNYIINLDNSPGLNNLVLEDLDYLYREHLKITGKVRTIELWACIMMRPPDPDRSLSYSGGTPPKCKTCEIFEDSTAICSLKIARMKAEKNLLKAERKGFRLIGMPVSK